MRSSFPLSVVLVLGGPLVGFACSSSSSQSQDSPSTSDGGSSEGSGSSSGTSGGSSGAGGSSGGSSGASTDGGSGGKADGGDAGQMDAGPAGPFPFPPVTYQGGPLVTAPKVVTITFPGDSLASQLATYGSSATSNTYWDAIRAGYCGGGNCIGDGPAGTSVALTTAPAASYTDSSQGGASTLQTFLTGLISGNEVPAPDDNTIYALYFPTTTTISLDGAASCQVFDGYHNSMTVGAQQQPVYYAVIPECPAPQMTPQITTLQNTTITASHEFIEASSDPSDNYFSFYLDLSNPATWGWNDIQGGEIADMCVDPFGLGQDETTEGGFTVQRIWSIQNASLGKNPCVPIPAGEVYFNAYSKDSVLVMDVGQSKTIEVDAVADGPMGAWTVLPQDWTSESTTYLSFTIAGDNSDAGAQVQVQSGDHIQVQVTLLADPSTAPYREADGVIVSANGNAQTTTAAHFWPFVVLTTAEAQDAGVTMMRQVHRSHPPHPRNFFRNVLTRPARSAR